MVALSSQPLRTATLSLWTDRTVTMVWNLKSLRDRRKKQKSRGDVLTWPGVPGRATPHGIDKTRGGGRNCSGGIPRSLPKSQGTQNRKVGNCPRQYQRLRREKEQGGYDRNGSQLKHVGNPRARESCPFR